MPRSKRDKQVSLTKTKKKVGLARKETIVSSIRQRVDDHEHIFVFMVDNVRTSKLIDVRQHFKSDSMFSFGKRTLMAKALGRSPTDEYVEGVHRVSKFMAGNSGLMFTNREPKEVIKYFEEHCEMEYSRAGNLATSTVKLGAGPLEQFQFSLEPQLRKLGMPTSLKKGIIQLNTDFTVCEKGNKLTAEQANILKLFGIQMSMFRVTLKCYWSKSTGKLRKLVAKSPSNSSTTAKTPTPKKSAAAKRKTPVKTVNKNSEQSADVTME